MSAYSYIQLFKHTNCLSYNLKPELFILGIILFFSMSLYGFIVIQRPLILLREIFSLQHYIQNKSLCKTLSISPDLSPISKISLRLNSEAIFSPLFIMASQCAYWCGLLEAVCMEANNHASHRDHDELGETSLVQGSASGGLVLQSVYGCVSLKTAKNLAELSKYLSALLDWSQNGQQFARQYL